MTWENMSELREELDKNGIAWSGDYDDNGDTTAWKSPRGQLFSCGHERFNHDLYLYVSPVTAKQAIAATLSDGECEVEETEWLSYGGEGCDTYRHTLSCGHVSETFDEEPPNFCCKCGAKVRKDV